ncbi:hypothetical protein Goklo_016376 [Gossypium klotzschianum]|uniref:C2 domain-containing protein n=2 Tax=Gossypium TaxID=3633 RepID=A0A7J8UE19_9ROSI|nr:hypothetical protein [Gossypium klotzschianum]
MLHKLVQKVKTNVVKKNCNPEWCDEVSLSIKDLNDPIELTVYDKDTLGADDPMGTTEIDLKPYLEAARLRKELQELPNGCALKKVQPSGTNDLADESRILWENGRITQDMRLKLRNVESGEVLIQIEWVDIPGCKGLDPDF